MSIKQLLLAILALHEYGDTLEGIGDRYFRGQAETLLRVLEAEGFGIPADVLFPILADAINDSAMGNPLPEIANRVWKQIIMYEKAAIEKSDIERREY